MCVKFFNLRLVHIACYITSDALHLIWDPWFSSLFLSISYILQYMSDCCKNNILQNMNVARLGFVSRKSRSFPKWIRVIGNCSHCHIVWPLLHPKVMWFFVVDGWLLVWDIGFYQPIYTIKGVSLLFKKRLHNFIAMLFFSFLIIWNTWVYLLILVSSESLEKSKKFLLYSMECVHTLGRNP